METITADEMRALEAAAMASGAVSGATLMERAGRGVAEIAQACANGATEATALVLCGPGNNGGDGYVVARLLAQSGWAVTVLGLGARAAMPADAAENRRRWESLGPVHEMADGLPEGQAPQVIIDALFGIGLTRPIAGDLAQFLSDVERLASRCGAQRIAIDLPSGLETDRGEVLGAVLPADRTVTFHRPKPAHRLRPDLCGSLSVVEIGL